jgi:hypothetical protein
LEWEQVLVHSADPMSLGQWWAEALGWVVVHSSADEFEIRPEPNRLPGLDFVRLEESKKAKSRLHLDFRPDDQDAEVARLVSHGAKRVDIGQGESSWVVLADPEGNEFCVLGQDVSSANARSPRARNDGTSGPFWDRPLTHHVGSVSEVEG